MVDKNILIQWLKWHFIETPRFLFLVWKNYIMFVSNYFSLPGLLKSFFAPWRKYNWRYPKIIQFGEFFNTLISNAFSRLLGSIMRVFLIIAGIFFQIFVIFLGLTIILLWIFLPFIIIGGFLFLALY